MILKRRRWVLTLAALVGILASASSSKAQELDARAYANAPVGVNFFGTAATFSSGSVLVDRSVPVEDLDAEIAGLGIRYARTVGVFGRSAKIKLLLPASSAEWTGTLVGGERRSRKISGTGDARVAFEVNFAGSPALDVGEFAKFKQKTIVGASIELTAPTGQYDPSKLFNLGANRWAVAAELAVSHAIGKWIVEGATTAWFFTDNDDFFGGSTLEQDPLYALQIHAIYTFRRGFWLGFGTGAADGGQTAVDGVRLTNLGTNTRTGIRLVYPLTPRQGMVFDLSTGLTTRLGADFDNVTVGYQYMWLRKKDAAATR